MSFFLSTFLQFGKKYLSLQHRGANLSPRCVYIMAKARVSTNPMYVGGAGGYSFYVRGGEQIVRQRKNNSNYGESASRTFPQMVRRVRWPNLVNLYKLMKSWQPKAYESKKEGQTDYNIFMSLNIGRASVALTKDMSLADNCVIEPLQISRGSLPSVALVAVAGRSVYSTDIVVSSAIDANTTVGQLSADIIANNIAFSNGDNIAMIKFQNWTDPRTEWPIARSVYAELTLDSSSVALVADVPVIGAALSRSSDGVLAIASNLSSEVAATIIHTRKSAQQLQVSTQEIVMMDSSLIDLFTGDAWVMTCIETYGLDADVLLAPGEGGGAAPYVLPLYLRRATLDGDQYDLLVTASGSYLQFRAAGSSVDSVPVIAVGAGAVSFMSGEDIADSLSWGAVSVPSVAGAAGVVTLSYGGREYVIDTNADTITPAVQAVYPS